MTLRLARGLTHVPAALALVVAVAVAIPACRDVVAGDTVNAISDLCEQLTACYGADAFDCSEMEQLLRDAAPSASAAFLDQFDPAICIGTCPGALACLDIEPFCGTGACDSAQDCCGWSSAEADCVTIKEAKQCCKPDGIGCLNGEECCKGRCENDFCGGESCVPVGDGCGEPEECCTELCLDGTCAIKDCADPGDTCALDDDCCPSADEDVRVRCDGIRPTLTCVVQGEPMCSELGLPCDANSGLICCSDLVCVPGAEGLVCNEPEPACGSAGQACDLITDCCDAHTCDAIVSSCIECLPIDAPCMIYTDCCTLNCKTFGEDIRGTCACEPGNCHDPCAMGDAMGGECTDDPDWGGCVAEVIARDAYCTCNFWDDVCVSEAVELCGPLCPR